MIGATDLPFFERMNHDQMTSRLSDYNPSIFFEYPDKFIVFHKDKVIYILPATQVKKRLFKKKNIHSTRQRICP